MADPEPTWFEDMTKRVREVQRDEAGNLTTESYLHVCEGNLKIFTIIFNGCAGPGISMAAQQDPSGGLAEGGWPRMAGDAGLAPRGSASLRRAS